MREISEKEILTALKACASAASVSGCRDCPLRCRVNCRDRLAKLALDLIEQKEELLKAFEHELGLKNDEVKRLRETMAAIVEQHRIIIKDLMDQMNHPEEKPYDWDEKSIYT